MNFIEPVAIGVQPTSWSILSGIAQAFREAIATDIYQKESFLQ